MIHRSPLSLGGVHDQTSALRDLLAADRIEAPHTGLPPSEALLLGLGGGIGAAVFTFQYQGHLPHLYVETRCTPQFAYDLAFVQRAAAGLGLSLTVTTATSAKAATKALDAVLAAGRPALCLVDANTLPHHAGTKGMGALPWVVVVHEQRGEMVSITDRTPVRFEISRASLDAARASYAKGKNAVASLQPGNTGSLTAGKLTAGIRAGIHYCVEELAGREVKKGFGGNFGLRALDKWIAEVSRKGKDGWRTRFAPGAPLAAGLRQAYAWIETNGTGGGGFRRLYADFLREAAAISGDTRFVSVATRYDKLAADWTALFTSLLPDGSPLGEIRRLLQERATAMRRGDAREVVSDHDRALDALVKQCDPFPGDAEWSYGTLAEGLAQIVADERAAAGELAAVLN